MPDAVLQLLDRQVLDIDGRMVGKVDDLALDADLRVVALLTGTAALLPRLGGTFGDRVLAGWDKLGAEQADRTLAYRIDLRHVSRVGSAISLDRSRVDLLHREVGRSLRLGDLLALDGEGDRLHRHARVLDVRLDEDLRVAGFLVGPGRPGGLLGYDRRQEQGPRLVGGVVRWLHRHAGHADREQCHVDLDRKVLRVDGPLGPVTGRDDR